MTANYYSSLAFVWVVVSSLVHNSQLFVHPCRLSTANSSVPNGPPSAQGSARAPPLPSSALYAKFGLASKKVYLLGYQRSQRRNFARWLHKRGVVISAYLPKVRRKEWRVATG